MLRASSSVVPTGTVKSGLRVITSPIGRLRLFSKRRSRLVRMPTSRPSLLPSSVIGTPEMRYCCIRSRASARVLVAASVIGLTIIPLSERLTRSTSAACSSIDRFLWITPRPPICAMAIARPDSVTVSIAALRIGTLSRMRRVSRVETSTWAGTTVECCGTSRMSSKVSAVARAASAGEEESVNAGLVSSMHSSSSSGHAVALLVLLPAATRARVVAAHLRLVAPDRLARVVAPDPGRGRRVRRPALRSPRPRGGKGGNGLRGGVVEGQRRGAAGRCHTGHRHLLLLDHRPQREQPAHHLFLDAAAHVLVECEAFLLVLDQRVALAVAAQPDAFLEVVERVEVVLPLRVDDLQRDGALQPSHHLLAAHRLPGASVLLGQLPDLVADLVWLLAVQ